MLSGSELDDLCIIANNQGSMKRKIKSLFKKDFIAGNVDTRKTKLGTIYNNGNNVDHLIELVG